MNGYEIRARRRAREIAQEMRWSGMAVPPLYDRMAREFQELVRSGDYAAWLTTAQLGGRPQAGGIAGHAPPRRSRTTRAAPGPDRLLLDQPGPLYA